MFSSGDDVIVFTLGTQNSFNDHFCLLFVLDPEVHHPFLLSLYIITIIIGFY